MGEIAAAVEKQLHALTKTSILHSTESAATGILNNSATRWLHSLDRSPLVFFLPQIITELCKPHGYQLLSYLTYDSRMHAPCTPLFTLQKVPSLLICSNTWSRNNKSHQKSSRRKVEEEKIESLRSGAASIYAIYTIHYVNPVHLCTCTQPAFAAWFNCLVNNEHMHPTMAYSPSPGRL